MSIIQTRIKELREVEILDDCSHLKQAAVDFWGNRLPAEQIDYFFQYVVKCAAPGSYVA